MTFDNTAMHIQFFPALPMPWMWGVLIAFCVILALSFISYKKGILFRILCSSAFFLALLNPSLVQEERAYVKDIGVVVVDESLSQSLGDRENRRDLALSYIGDTLKNDDTIEYRIVHAPKDAFAAGQTDLFSAVDDAFSNIPEARRAGVVLLTDGQVHDVPGIEHLQKYGPVHALITGQKNEKDRRIEITQAPAYGLVGDHVTIKFRIVDTDNIRAQNAKISITMHDGRVQTDYITIGKEHAFTVPIEHASDNIFILDAETVDDELTYANNKASVVINGVRDRLKVLLVSGVPYAGERTWRNLLTSDPGVDLVHFTILREPDKFDYTPKSELSLIAFPFRELFEVKLYDFDLIIFDRYRVNNILPKRYFENIAEYVRKGGAFLEASGPSFAKETSVYDTPLGAILPAQPTGDIISQAYTPSVSAIGINHPVTKDLTHGRADEDKKRWGDWLRYIDIKKLRGDTLMHSVDQSPLLILDRVEQGRVAQLSSDHIWLWSRGYDGGGPHAELLRRIVHWLMKEPDLDERTLDVNVHDKTIIIKKRALTDATGETISVKAPDGEISTIDLTLQPGGFLEHEYNADKLGMYVFEDAYGARKPAMVGNLSTKEMIDVISTEDRLSSVIERSGGSVIWLEKTPRPKVHYKTSAARYGGSNWIAFKRNNHYTIAGVKSMPVLPDWVLLALLLACLTLAWWREGQRKP